MALIDKIPQKFLHLKSKRLIENFFLSFEEQREINLTQKLSRLGTNLDPLKYIEKTKGSYLIKWNNNQYSKGNITVSDTEEMSNFVDNAKKNENIHREIYFPTRSVYPIVRAYSKKTADYIDNPDFLFNLSELFNELDYTVKSEPTEAIIKVIDGTKYAFCGDNYDFNYVYTKFYLKKNFGNIFSWEYKAVEAPSKPQIEEMLSFFGNIVNLIKTRNVKKTKGNALFDLFIPPYFFERIFTKTVLDQIKGDNVYRNLSTYSKEDFRNKKRILGFVSISYDPLINLKLGTYSFTNFGLIAQRQYFVKAGRLETPILNELNYKDLGFDIPTVEITNFENIKIEGLKKSIFKNIRNIDQEFIYITDIKAVKFITPTKILLIPDTCLLMTDYNKICKLENFTFEFDLIESIANRNLELIEFIDGKIGARLKRIKLNIV